MGNCVKTITYNEVKKDPLEGCGFSLTQDGIKTLYHITPIYKNEK